MRVFHFLTASLMRRALLPIATLMVLITATIAFGIGRLVIDQAQDTLAEKARQTTDLATLGLIEPLWTLNTEELQTVLRRLATDPDFVGAVVRDDSGKDVAHEGSAGKPDATAGYLRVQQDLDRNGRKLGALDLTLSGERSFAAARRGIWATAASGGAILFVVCGILFALLRSVIAPITRITGATDRLSAGDLTVEIPALHRRDEVGALARALHVFKEHMVREVRLVAEREAERRQAETEKHIALVAMADTIETETGTALERIHQRTSAMIETSDEMTASALRTGASAETAATAAGQALANAQTVASAAEQLTASIREIGGQVRLSNAVVGRAVAAGNQTRTTIEALSQEVDRIGTVADMIGEIAAKTNLLALNATIEAARAGDAGRGFAVVANEVKALATQTARSTQEIGRHIDQVRAATGASVAAVALIEQTITEMSAITGSIAAAVEQQGTATTEIARSVTETANSANEMTVRTTEVSNEADETERHASEVRENATGLNGAMEQLRHSMIQIVRTSITEVDGGQERRYPQDLDCRLAIAGHMSTAHVTELSEHGACIRNAPSLPAGTRGTLTLDRVDFPLPFRVHSTEGDGLHLEFDLDAATATKFRPMPERLTTQQAA
jgi:methyl-accepting chemotaxis protein